MMPRLSLVILALPLCLIAGIEGSQPTSAERTASRVLSETMDRVVDPEGYRLRRAEAASDELLGWIRDPDHGEIDFARVQMDIYNGLPRSLERIQRYPTTQPREIGLIAQNVAVLGRLHDRLNSLVSQQLGLLGERDPATRESASRSIRSLSPCGLSILERRLREDVSIGVQARSRAAQLLLDIQAAQLTDAAQSLGGDVAGKIMRERASALAVYLAASSPQPGCSPSEAFLSAQAQLGRLRLLQEEADRARSARQSPATTGKGREQP